MINQLFLSSIRAERQTNMITAGIVAEYNPFHNGHKYHIEKTREITGAECIAVVMSGNYVQRGEPAIFSKHTRAAAAVRLGADLVIELPAYFSLKSAEGFADGAVTLLNEINCDYISFGTETENLDELNKAADCLLNESTEFKKVIRENLKMGKSYASSRQSAASKAFDFDTGILKTPNNILAIEYIKAIKKHNFSSEPIGISRIGAGHDSGYTAQNIASASYIRNLIYQGKPYEAFTEFTTDETPVFIKDFEAIILYLIKTSDYLCIPDTTDGLYERIKSATSFNLEELILEIKTKRHAHSRIKRVLMNILIGNCLNINLNPSYIRVLAANKRGREKLSELKERCNLPIIIKPATYKENDDLWELEKRATLVRNIITKGLPEEKISPVIFD